MASFYDVAAVGRGKLSANQVWEVRRRAAVNDETYPALAAAYGLSVNAIGEIVRGKSWTGDSHFGPPKERWDIDKMLVVSETRNALIASNPSGFPL